MTTATFSISTERTRLDPREVEKLINYTMGEMERRKMIVDSSSGKTFYVGTSRNALIKLVKDALRTFSPMKARQTIDEHIANLVEVERTSYKLGHTTYRKKNAPAGQGEGEVKELETHK